MRVGGSCSVEGCNRQHMYNSPVCYKHKGQKTPPPPSKKTKQVTETNRPAGEDLWWTDEDESQRCDDNPNLHYGLCEFDAYDGICFHCKNLVHPDLHLIHLIHNDRNKIWRFEYDMVEDEASPIFHKGIGKNWAKTYKSRLSEIWEEFEERDIMFEAQLGYGAARAEAIQQMCYADKEYILSEVKENLSKAGAPTEGEGIEPWVWNSLEAELNSHFERIRDWDIERVDWSPEDWGLEKPQPLPSSSKYRGIPYFDYPPDTKLHPFGWVAIAAYVWYVFDNNLLDIFMGVNSSSGMEILCFIFMIPVLVIHNIFSYTPKHDDGSGLAWPFATTQLDPEEVTTEDKKIPTEVYEQRLKISSGVLAISFLLPWWGYSSGFQALRWAPQEAWFVLTEARLWDLPFLQYVDWQMSTLLPLVFVATFVATWSRQQDPPEFGRKASNFHLLFFAVWYLIGIYNWGEFLPNEWNYAVFIAAASGIGLHPTAYGLAEKLSNATSE